MINAVIILPQINEDSELTSFSRQNSTW